MLWRDITYGIYLLYPLLPLVGLTCLFLASFCSSRSVLRFPDSG